MSWPKNSTKLILKLTDKVMPANTLEFPAAGFRSGTLKDEGANGFYWTSSERSSTDAYYLNFYAGYSSVNDTHHRIKKNEFGVRCLL